MAKSSKEESKIQEDITKLFQDQTQSAQKLHSVLSDIAGGPLTQQSLLAEKVRQKFEGIVNLTKNLQDSIDDNIEAIKIKNKALQTGVSLEVAELKVKQQAAVAQANAVGLYREEVLEIFKKYNQAIKLQETLEEQLKIQKQELKYAEEISKYDTERDEMLKKIKEKAFLLTNIFTDQRLAQAILVKQLMSGYESIKEVFADFRKEGLTVSQAFSETGVALGAMFSLSGASLQENAELMAGMAESMGNMNSITTDTVTEVGKLAKTLGVSAGEAGKLQGQLMNMPGATAESATNTMEFAGALAKAAHVAPGAVMKDMAANAEEIAINTKNGGKDMAVVSVAAHKLGIEMSSITKMSSGLLDFENSINKQMEASVLLGREINLDKAREAALNGDLLGATQEMLKNIGGEAEFNRMNVLQRKALAESMGVSVSDLSKMVKNQDQLANLTEEQQMALADGSLKMDEILGNAGGVASRLKDGGLALVGMVGSMGSFVEGLKSSVGFAKDLVGGFKSGAGFLGKMGGALKGGVGLGEKVKAPEIPKTDALADSGKKMSGVGMMAGFKANMKALASGFKAMGQPGVLMGVVNTALAGPALLLAIPAIPFLLFMGLAPLKQLGTNFMNLAIGLEFMGSGKVALGSLNTMLFAAAGVVGLVAIPFMAFIALLGAVAGSGLTGLSIGLQAMGNPAVAIGVGVLSLLILSVGAGMLMFGVGVGVAAAGMSLLVGSLKDIPFENLMALPVAMLGIGAGLYMMGAAGAVAIPTILALIALAAVAPQLAVLGAALGGLSIGGNANSTKNKEEEGTTLKDVKDAIDSLTTAITTKKGDVTIDGRAIGHVLAPIISREINYTSR